MSKSGASTVTTSNLLFVFAFSCSPKALQNRETSIYCFKSDAADESLGPLSFEKVADENARKGRDIERFSIPGVLHGHSLLPTSTFNTDSSGYIVEGSAKFDAYIHVLEETYDIREVHELGKFSVKWKVDNFLAWEAIRGGLRGYHLVPCQYFDLDGCLLRMEVCVSTSGTLTVIKQKNPTDTDWEQLEYYTNETKTCNIGYLSDILKEGAGFVVNDKIVFCCHISLWKQEDTLISSSTTTSSS